MARIIMCGSFKGGVGKTASSWNLAYSLAEMGKRVLAVDFDSQANLTTCFGIEDPAAVPVTIGHLMMNRLEDEEMPDPSEFIQSRNGVDFILDVYKRQGIKYILGKDEETFKPGGEEAGHILTS